MLNNNLLRREKFIPGIGIVEDNVTCKQSKKNDYRKELDDQIFEKSCIIKREEDKKNIKRKPDVVDGEHLDELQFLDKSSQSIVLKENVQFSADMKSDKTRRAGYASSLSNYSSFSLLDENDCAAVEAKSSACRKKNQETYKTQLDDQIKEKKKIDGEEKEKWRKEDENRNEQIIQYELLCESRKVTNQFADNSSPQHMPKAHVHFSTDTKTDNSRRAGYASSLSSYSSFSLTDESDCAADEAKSSVCRKKNQETYKTQLDDQIRAKKKIDGEEKEKMRKEDENRNEQILQYEQLCESRKAINQKLKEQEEKLMENLSSIQRCKKSEQRNSPQSFPLHKHVTKNCAINPTNHDYHSRITKSASERMKNNNSLESSVLINAPHMLSTLNQRCKSEAVICSDDDTSGNTSSEEINKNKPPSPVISAVRTRNLLKSLPYSEQIPSTVSMSDNVRTNYEKHILANLPEIRRHLMHVTTKKM